MNVSKMSRFNHLQKSYSLYLFSAKKMLLLLTAIFDYGFICPITDRGERMDCKNINGMRRCSRCGIWHPATTEFFHKTSVKMSNRIIWHGLRPECKQCHNRGNRELRQKIKNKKRRALWGK